MGELTNYTAMVPSCEHGRTTKSGQRYGNESKSEESAGSGQEGAVPRVTGCAPGSARGSRTTSIGSSTNSWWGRSPKVKCFDTLATTHLVATLITLPQEQWLVTNRTWLTEGVPRLDTGAREVLA